MITKEVLGLKRGFPMTKWLPDHKGGLNWQTTSKITQKPLSALTGDLAAVILAIDHSTFTERARVKLLRLNKRGLPDHTMAFRPQKRPEFVRKTSKIPTKQLSALAGPPSAVTPVISEPLYFHEMSLSKVFRAQEFFQITDYQSGLNCPKNV